jgi:hypothetical protein
MIRLRGDRTSLLAALLAHWSEEQACLPQPPPAWYEWTWLHRHLDDLQLCNASGAMAQAAGGSQHVRQLLRQAEICLAALAEECERRGVQPERQTHSMASGEHDWEEVSNGTISRAWGLDG